jgi:hypothetical protein
LFSAAWAPLLMRCVDEAMRGVTEKLRWILLGVAAVALLALDGYPQFAFYTALASGLYALLLLPGAKSRWRCVAAVAAMFAGGWAIAAVQILTSAQVAGESIRAGGLSFADASAFALPPENLLTLIVPGLFGDVAHLPYFGRWYWWEACVFVGPAAVALAVYACAKRRSIPAAIMVVAMLLLAVGPATPLFSVLYHVLPGFSSFRATTRFGMIGILFLSQLAASGWDEFASSTIRRPRLAACVGGAGVVLALAAIWAMNAQKNGEGDFTNILRWMADTKQALDSGSQLAPGFSDRAAQFACGQFAVAAGIALMTAIFLGVAKKPAAVLIYLLAIGQIVWFAAAQSARSDHSPTMPDNWKSAVAQLSPGQRVLLISGTFAETGAANGFLNAAGFNPLVLGRMARFLGAVQGDQPDNLGVHYPIHVISPLYRMLRCGLVIPTSPGGAVYPVSGALPRLLLLNSVEQVADESAAQAAVMDDGFDPAQTVVLESVPDPAPRPAAQRGWAKVIAETSDRMEIEADLPAPQILLITDAYSAGWLAAPLAGSAQTDYHILPADQCLRAVPLSAGHHHFIMEYRPGAFDVGKWISLAALAGYGVLIGWWIRGRRATRSA